MMFPRKLDGAEVLWYTNKGNYGPIFYDTGEVFDQQSYFAICRYPGDSGYYLFSCNDTYEVISDFPCSTVDQCKQNAARGNVSLVWHSTSGK